MLNPDLIRSRCQEIEASVQRLEKIAGLSEEVFLGNNDLQDVACYRLLVAIEAAIALCYHVSAKTVRKVPEGYAACFKLLAEEGWVTPDLGAQLQRMARFRNMLIHVYWEVDHHQVYSLIQEHLNDLRAFTRAIVGRMNPK